MKRSTEHERIESLLRRLRPSDALLVPNGDDAAVLRGDPRPLSISVDAAVEGVHFRRAFAPLDVLGRRAAVAALSDLAAMGAEPTALFAALVLPRDFADEELELLMGGVANAAREVGAVVAGGNLSRGGNLAMTFTVVGHHDGAPLTRLLPLSPQQARKWLAARMAQTCKLPAASCRYPTGWGSLGGVLLPLPLLPQQSACPSSRRSAHANL